MLIILNNKKNYNLNNLSTRLFYSTVFLFSDKDLIEKVKNLKENNNMDDNIKLSSSEEESLRSGLSELKKQISNPDTSKESLQVSDYFNQGESQSSSFLEAFPNYNKKNNLIAEESDSHTVFEITKEIGKQLKFCLSSENKLNNDCVNKINLSDIIRQVMSKESSGSDNLRENVGNVINSSLEVKSIQDFIGDIKIREIQDLYTKVKDKLPIEISPNYREIGVNLISYSVLLKTFNKLVYDRPMPTGISNEDLKVIKLTRTISRYWFAGLVAPLLLFGFHQIREKGSYVNINVNLSEVNNSNLNNSNTTLNKGWGLFLLLKQKINTSLGRLIIITLLLFMFLIFFDISFIFYIKSMINNNYYLKYFLLLTILIPIFINGITLYLLEKLNKTGKISIPQNKILAGALTRYINYINYIGKNKELLNYYKGRCKGELIFYNILIILLVLIQFIYL